jgi:hypothetical protein
MAEFFTAMEFHLYPLLVRPGNRAQNCQETIGFGEIRFIFVVTSTTKGLISRSEYGIIPASNRIVDNLSPATGAWTSLAEDKEC